MSDPTQPLADRCFGTEVITCPECGHGIDPHGTEPGGICGVGDATGKRCECLMQPNGIAYARIAELEEQAADRTATDLKQFHAMLAALDTPDAASIMAASVRRTLDTVTEALGAWLPASDRCTGTTTRAALLVMEGDERAIWCMLPGGHAGMHHSEVLNDVPTGVEGFARVEAMGVDWPEVLEAAATDDDSTYWTAGRDDRGDIRLTQGRGALIAEGDDSRAEIEGWLQRCDNSRWRRMYGAALALLNAEAASR